MKFPYSMLRDYVDTKLDANQIGDLLTMAGFELEGIEEVEDEPVLDIKVVSNRGDGLSVFGLAREVLAKDEDAKPTGLYEQARARFPLADTDAPDIGSLTSVQVETPGCTRYAARVFQHVPAKEAPDWIRTRLRQAGMRPISLIVDLTNYVMLELGQPMHAFDYDKLAGNRIVVRESKKGEKLVTLDGSEHELEGGEMMICDAEKPVAAAGIMGGLETEVCESTTRVLLESANFVNTVVRRVRNKLGLSTEASYRFERSVDPESVVAGLNRFAQLLAEVDGGQSLVPGIIDVYPLPPSAGMVPVRVSRAERLLGMRIGADVAGRHLERLGFEVKGDGEPFEVTAPTWRPDIVREDDLVEEIGRVHGYDKIPEVLPQGSTTQGGVFGFEARVDAFRDGLLRSGFVQTVSHSLADKHPLDDPEREQIGPRNPHSPEMAWLRNSLWPSVAQAAVRNGGQSVHLFEIGRVFTTQAGKPTEYRAAGLLSVGALQPAARAKEELQESDFFSLKGVLAESAAHVGATLQFEQPLRVDTRLHPTRQAQLMAKGECVGILGQIHPDVADSAGLPPETILAELLLEPLLEHASETKAYRAISRNPAVRRDIAVLVEKSVQYERLEMAIKAATGDVLEKLWLFDVYEGAGIPEGHHSLAMALQLRKFGENFTDEEANQVREKAVQALEALGAKRR